MSDSRISHNELIRSAQRDLGETDVTTATAALEAYYGHGAADQDGGNVEAPEGHYIRVANWVLVTDELGGTELTSFPSVSEACRHTGWLDDQYAGWDAC